MRLLLAYPCHTELSRWLIRQKERRHPCGLRLLVSIEFQGLFHSPTRGSFHRSLTVLYAIDHFACLVLDGGPPRFKPDYTCPILLGSALQRSNLDSFTGLLPSMATLSRVFSFQDGSLCPCMQAGNGTSRDPAATTAATYKLARFRLFPVRSSLLRESHVISFPQLLRYFSWLSVPSR